MRLHKIILQLNDKNYKLLVTQFKETKADKFLSLLTNYREKKVSDNDLMEQLDMKQAAFYTLKSRLYDKVQESLYKNITDTRVELLQNVANIKYLIYKIPRETAIGILNKLEKELLENDMPNELISVYKALILLHIHSKKYYGYLQLYNKHVAFNLAQDKAEELLSLFCKTLSEFYLTRDQQTQELLVLYKKEMLNVCNVYQSHHLKVFKNILNIHFALFSPVESEMKDDSSIEEMLKELTEIIKNHPEDRTYKHLIQVIEFLYFEYYHQLKLHKNAATYYEKLIDNTEAFLLFDHCCFAAHFLVSKIKHSLAEQMEVFLYQDSRSADYEPSSENLPEYILYHWYLASASFYSEKYSEAASSLKKLINEISLKDFSYSEIEIKLFLSLMEILTGKIDQAEINIRSVSRKIADENDEVKYLVASTFLKILKTSIKPDFKGKYEKLKDMNQMFEILNNGKDKAFECIKLHDTVLKHLAK
ncbi:MAG: hypothetical protein A3F72_18440 [Bacteroidetes bacterium RIFCSPLOWO2_12_FULL_35_15]|nr:MAG: hypothetical protein A3F72_18440 [Bacteroidetes bacterium RIFCSPLOWO2_12_FULL_35_15]